MYHLLNGEKSLFKKMVLGKPDICLRKTEVDPYLIPHTKINSKLFKNLNIIPKTIKLPEDNIRQSFVTLVCNWISLTEQQKHKQQKQTDK